MIIQQNGIAPDIPNNIYHRDTRDSDGKIVLSSSILKRLADSNPAKAFLSMAEPEPDWNCNKLTALQVGSLFHTLVLEPDLFAQEYAVLADGARQKPIIDAGKKPVRQRDYDVVALMRDGVMNHPEASRLLTGGHAEYSAFSLDSRGFWKKARPDYLKSENGSYICIDLKSTIDASQGAFANAISNYKYHWSAAFYIDVLTDANPGIRFDDFRFIAVEKKLPQKNPEIGVAVYRLYPEDIYAARTQYQPYLDIYEKCLNDDHWPGYSEKTEMISLPYRATKIEQNSYEEAA